MPAGVGITPGMEELPAMGPPYCGKPRPPIMEFIWFRESPTTFCIDGRPIEEQRKII